MASIFPSSSAFSPPSITISLSLPHSQKCFHNPHLPHCYALSFTSFSFSMSSPPAFPIHHFLHIFGTSSCNGNIVFIISDPVSLLSAYKTPLLLYHSCLLSFFFPVYPCCSFIFTLSVNIAISSLFMFLYPYMPLKKPAPQFQTIQFIPENGIHLFHSSKPSSYLLAFSS